MSSASIAPVVKGLYLCDGHIGFPGGETDLIGLFNRIDPPSYPHQQDRFVAFAQMAQGIGKVPFFLEIKFISTNQLIFASNVHHLSFPNRFMTIQMAYTVQGCTFPKPGIYCVELFRNNQWVADTTLELS